VSLLQTFKGRLVEVINQEQDFAAIGTIGEGSSTADTVPLRSSERAWTTLNTNVS
jgi:hypothetical protein